jgi:dynein light chain Tctex-type 1
MAPPTTTTTSTPLSGFAGAGAQEQARKATTAVVERVLAGCGFDASQVSEWCDDIGAQTVAALAAQHPGYRFAAAATIVQRGKGAGVSTASAAAFDPATDAAFTVRWENQSLLCLVSVFGMAFS